LLYSFEAKHLRRAVKSSPFDMKNIKRKSYLSVQLTLLLVHQQKGESKGLPFLLDEDGTLEIVHEEAGVVTLIYEWHAEGASLRTISSRLMKMGIKAPRGGDMWGIETLITD